MKIIAFGNSRYKKIAHNWALYLKRHDINNYIIYSLDQDIYDYLVNHKINTELVNLNMFNKNGYGWNSRMQFITQLLDKNIDVLHSDLDAIWLKNPLGFISDEFDVVASTGAFPRDINKKIGYTLCMGWIYYKSSSIVKQIFRNILSNHSENKFDDQVEFNREIFNSQKYENLQLKVLDKNIISRKNPHNDQTYVAHPLSPKNIDRECFLKNKKLWVLTA